MKFYELITEGKADPEIVAKFADVSPSQRSYYIMKWAEEKGIDSDDAMEMAGYERGDYIGAGAYMWNYVGESKEAQTESLQALANHVKEGTALCDSPFRHGSQAYIETFQLAKKLREAGALPELDWESEEMLATDVGEKVTLENGETVWLDIPYLIEDEDVQPRVTTLNRDGNKVEIAKTGDSMSPVYHLKINGKEHGKFNSEKKAMQYVASLKEDDDDVNDSGMIGEPDAYYDAEERKEAYNQLQDALDSANGREHDYVVDGICPECGGSSYMDGDYEGEEDSCYGWGNFGCDEGEMEGALWKEIKDSDERQAERKALKDKPQPSDEELENAMKQLHTDYVKSGRMNAFELPSILRQMYPEISKPKAREIGGKFFKSFGEAVDQGSGEGEAMVAKMLAKALGDDNRWADMSAAELYAELESVEPKKADMIALVAKMLYDVKLQERAYKDVGVADVVKDKRGKEFKFDKGSKKFKSVDGEEAAVNTTLGKDLMRIRRNAMKRTSPSYNKEDIDVSEAEYNGKDVKLNKPMRQSGGGKKYKVYVKNPKTGRVKKISFGDAGLKTKSGNKKRAKSFAARHNCEKKNDKMKAGYWACRLPRYGLVKGGKWW